MNERIGQLAEEAGLLGPTSRVGNSHAATEKFARLIVRECIDIANNVHMCRDGRPVAEDIKKHFGVAE